LTGGGAMGSKFSAGNKVRIKSSDFLGRPLDPRIQQYENMVGEIVEGIGIIGFLGEKRLNLNEHIDYITIYQYTVRLNEEITLHDVLEDCLEIVQ
jgi:hypothetical protein